MIKDKDLDEIIDIISDIILNYIAKKKENELFLSEEIHCR